MLVLIIWVNDKPITGNVMKIENIIEPRKAIVEYCEGELVRAKCRSFGVHTGLIGRIATDDKRNELEDILRGPAFEDLVKKHMSVAEQNTEASTVEPELPVMVHTPKQKKRKQLPTTDEVTEQSNVRKTTDVQRLLTENLLKKARTCEEEPARKHIDDTKDTRNMSDINKPSAPGVPDPDSSSQQQAVKDSERTESEYVTKKEFKDLQKKFQSLKDRVRNLEKNKTSTNLSLSPPTPTTPVQIPVETVSSPAPKANMSNPEVSSPVTSQVFNGKTYQQLQDLVCHTDSLFGCVHILITNLFDIPYILSHSVSGQAPNKATVPKPKFDTRLYDTMVSLIKEKFPRVVKSEITQKVQCVQKKYSLKNKQAK